MRAARLVQLMLLLEARQRTTAAALAEELGVSARTVHRDLDALAQTGVPIYTERGRGGGCRLVEGYRSRLSAITPEEADALFFAGMPSAAAELGIESLVATAQLKLRAALPRSIRAAATLAEQRFHLDPPGWFRTRMPDHPQLQEVAAAVWGGRSLTIRYHASSRRVSTRHVDPLGLVLKAGLWYLVARTEGELRVYRVSRIAEIVGSDEKFERPTGFNLADYWRTWAAGFEADRTRAFRLALRVHPAALADVEDLDVGPVETTAVDDDGWVRIVIHCEAERWARRAVLELGESAEVLEPRSLRNDIARLASKLSTLYDGS